MKAERLPSLSMGGAVFSPDRLYRYRLWRTWNSTRGRCVFVGVNPSKAAERDDDHTIRKCVGFALRWGFGTIDMVNLFAWCDTDQRGLLTAPEPVGLETDCRILQAFDTASRIVFAWGGGKTAAVRRIIAERVRAEQEMLFHYQPQVERGTLGPCDGWFPKHPLMLPYATSFVPITKVAP